MEKGRKEKMEKAFDKALRRSMNADCASDCWYWLGVSKGLCDAALIEKKYDLEQCKERIRGVKKLIKDDTWLLASAPPADIAADTEKRIENHKTLLTTLKEVKKQLQSEIDNGDF